MNKEEIIEYSISTSDVLQEDKKEELIKYFEQLQQENKQLKEKLNESPYCEVCGHCGEIGCCGIRNFISEHIEGKTNCKNEGIIINELISLCEYKDEVFEENKQLKDNWNKLKEKLWNLRNIAFTKEFGNEWINCLSFNNDILPIIKEMQELEDK